MTNELYNYLIAHIKGQLKYLKGFTIIGNELERYAQMEKFLQEVETIKEKSYTC